MPLVSALICRWAGASEDLYMSKLVAECDTTKLDKNFSQNYLGLFRDHVLVPIFSCVIPSC